ncbi:hypothetical protein CCS01_01590 [Rhodopila globiformis]|uniref:Glycosyltransferase 61 catalytic domain-containing protein n=1 Tax=Rhodopila globiformis TaxID=1071 RepID=A0A2S6NNQ3_RHOGL|nr:hypothetical protein CCS01_01590 [Rhodopila globiformis]
MQGREAFMQQMQATTNHYDEILRLVLNDAIVAGQGSVVSASGKLLRESAVEFLNHGRTPDQFQTAGDGQFTLSTAPEQHISTPSLLVKRPWWRNYGHWLVDGAALLATLSAITLPTDWQVVVGLQENPAMRKVVRDTVALLAPNVPIVEQPDNAVWTFSLLHYVTPVHVPPLFKLPLARNNLRALLIRQFHPAHAPRRIYVARSAPIGRRIVNESDLIEICRRRGFEVVFPEKLTVCEQASLFRNSEIVVGVKGAALTNTIFSPNSLGMIVLSPGTFTDPFFWDLAGQANIDYTEIFGQVTMESTRPSEQNFWIDPQIFSTEMDALVERLPLVTM